MDISETEQFEANKLIFFAFFCSVFLVIADILIYPNDWTGWKPWPEFGSAVTFLFLFVFAPYCFVFMLLKNFVAKKKVLHANPV